MKRDKTTDEKEWCPSTSVCPKECPPNKKLCEYQNKDDRGCKVEDLCVDPDVEC
jgi:hypothetical protein